MLTFRIKLILTLALLALVTAFGVTFLRGEVQEKRAQDAAELDARKAMREGTQISP